MGKAIISIKNVLKIFEDKVILAAGIETPSKKSWYNIYICNPRSG